MNGPVERRRAVLALEAALAEGSLPTALADADPDALGAPLMAVYGGLLTIDAGRPAARAPWIDRVLSTHAAATGPERRAFPPDTLPLPEAVRARAWGAGFGPAVEQAAVAAADARLVADLRGVSTIARHHHGAPELSDDTLGEALERLMHDVLAARWPTRFAPLLEDVLEQTDLRVKVPGASRRGTRVQVAATLPGPRHDRKAARARRAGVVLLSPGTMAAVVGAVPGAEAALPGGGVGVWARALRDQLTQALDRPVAEAGGPAARLPATTRALIWQVIEQGAAGAKGPARRHRTGPLAG